MKNKLLLTLGLSLLLILGACSNEKPPEEEPQPQDVLQKAMEGDYEMFSPYVISPIRQIHSINYRENDVLEIGRRLIEKSKEHFDVKRYKISEGQLIDEDRYYDLMFYKSDDNPDGLMTFYEEGLEIDGVKLEKPIFIRDIFEYNFFKQNSTDIDGVSVALVLSRSQLINSKTGETHLLSDEALFNIGQSLGLKLSAYIRSLEAMADVPVYIALYAQASDDDYLPLNYLPGYYIGDAFSVDHTTHFNKNNERWILLSDNEATRLIPEVISRYQVLRNRMLRFTGDESVGIVAKAFLIDNEVDIIRIEMNVGSKTYLELYGLAQAISHELEDLGQFNVPIKVNLMIFQKTRISVNKDPGKTPILHVYE